MKLNSFQLKWIAIITMFIDHTGAVLYPGVPAWRIIGRISFPIFCYLIVEGFFHTKDIYRYITRLGIFALISEIPYDLAFHGTILEFGSQNVFFTLILGIVLMYVVQKGSSILIKTVEVFLVLWAAQILRCDYSYRGICLIFIYYILREYTWAKLAGGAAWNLLYGIGNIQNFGALGTMPLALYNGERGPKIKYFFYVFYPAHLFVLYIIKMYCFNGTGL